METGFNYCGDKQAYFSSDERKWIKKIHKLKEQHPDEIEIIREPENNDGCIYCKLPAAWLKVSPPARRELTPEQREASSRRMAELVAKQKANRESLKQG